MSQHEPEVAAPADVLGGDPFRYQPLLPSSHRYEMRGGVVRLFGDSGEELWPLPGTCVGGWFGGA